MTIYYVSADTGSDTNNGISAGLALRTLQAAANITAPGDTVLVENGTYAAPSGGVALNITTPGTETAPITYEAAPGAQPVIEVPAGAWGGVNVFASWIVVKGFHVQGDAQGITLAYAQSQASNLGNPTTTATGISIGQVGQTTIVAHVKVESNTVSYMPGGGIASCESDYVTIQGNTVYGNANFSPYGASGISIYASQGVDNSTAIKNFVLNNVVFNNQELVGELAAGGKIADGEGIIIDDNSNDQTNGVQYAGGTLVANNLAYGNGSAGILAFSSSNVSILHNTTYQNGQTGFNKDEILAYAAHNVIVENNIMYAKSGSATEEERSSTNVTWDHNLLYNGSSSVSGPNDLTGNPLFVNPPAGNFQIATGSPAIGVANPAFPVATDLAGKGRPSTGADAGAYQSSTSAPPTTVTTGSGSDVLVLSMSEDAYQGDAQFTVSVDGKQQGGTFTTTASHASGASQNFTFAGYFGTGSHNVAVTFLNDAYNPSAPDASGSVDRNLYVDAVLYKGSGTKQTGALYSGGAQSFTVTGGTAQPATTTPVPVPTGSGSDRLVLRMSEDAYQGDAKFTVSVDGKQQGGTLTASAYHSTGDSNVFVLTGNWGAGAHAVQVQFINDAYGGTAATDRNLYVDSIGYDGVTYSNTAASMLSNGTRNFAVGGTIAAATAPADTLTVHLAEDAWSGNAQFVLTIDGKQISTPQDVVALHSSGAWQDLTFAGNFGAGSHTVGVKFLNDAWGGTPETDRNLYVNGVDCNGQHYGGGITPLWNSGTAAFTIATTH